MKIYFPPVYPALVIDHFEVSRLWPCRWCHKPRPARCKDGVADFDFRVAGTGSVFSLAEGRAVNQKQTDHHETKKNSSFASHVFPPPFGCGFNPLYP